MLLVKVKRGDHNTVFDADLFMYALYSAKDGCTEITLENSNKLLLTDDSSDEVYEKIIDAQKRRGLSLSFASKPD